MSSSENENYGIKMSKQEYEKEHDDDLIYDRRFEIKRLTEEIQKEPNNLRLLQKKGNF